MIPTPAQIAQLCPVEIRESPDRGNTLVATCRIEPEPPFGYHVYTDEALLVMPTYGSEDDQSGAPPEILKPGPQLWTDWWTYQQQTDDVKDRILGLYTDMRCPHAVAVRTYLTEKYEERQAAQQQEEKGSGPYGDDFDKGILGQMEEFAQFMMVIRFNSVELTPPSDDGEGPGTDFGHGLFETACRMNHSCKPNCIWVTSQDGRAKEVRAIHPIQEGEELTIDYVGETLKAIPQRRLELLQTKGFTCQCDRCAAQHDDTRRFFCMSHPTTGCPGAHFVVQPDLSTPARLLDCDVCGTCASPSYKEAMLAKELELAEELNALNRQADADKELNAERIAQLKPPHDLHSLAEMCFEMQGHLFATRGEFQSAAEAYTKQLACRTAILGKEYHSQTTAFCCERLGDALRHVNVEEAEEAYKRTVRHIQLMRGGIADPYSKCALVKLLEVQYRLAHSDPGELPQLRAVEGILAAVPEATTHIHSNAERPCFCSMCGNPAVLHEQYGGQAFQYCCVQHQELHRPLVDVVFEESKM